MNIRKLEQEYPVLLDYMRQQGYGKVAIGGIQARLKELFEQESSYVSYGDFYEKLLKRKDISRDGSNHTKAFYFARNLNLYTRNSAISRISQSY